MPFCLALNSTVGVNPSLSLAAYSAGGDLDNYLMLYQRLMQHRNSKVQEAYLVVGHRAAVGVFQRRTIDA